MGTTPRSKRRELRLRLERTNVVAITSDTSTLGAAGKAPASARGEAPLPRRGRSRTARYPREARIRVVEGEIINSPIAESISAGTPALSGSGGVAGAGDVTSNASSIIMVESEPESTGGEAIPSTSVESGNSSFDQVPRKGKKRGRKPKGFNCPDSHALSKMSSKRMDFEGDELDRVDFFKITKRPGHGLKRRKGLVECQLDDRLSSHQKDAIEEVTALFPQMSPKSIMAETLRVLETAGEAERRTQSMKGDLRRQIKVGVNVAKIAVQKLVADIAKGTGPSDEIRVNNLALEKEVIKLRREVDTLRRERTTMRKQINALQNTVQEMKDEDRDRRPILSPGEETRDEGCSPIRTRGRDRSERHAKSRDTDLDAVAESLPPAYRPPIGGVRKRLEDRPTRLTNVNEEGQIVIRTREAGRTSLKRGDTYAERTRYGGAGDIGRGDGLGGNRDRESPPPPMEYPVDGEAWTEAKSKRARKRMRRKEKAGAASDANAHVGTREKKGPGRVVVPPPPGGDIKAGVRRAGTIKGAASVSARDGASKGPTPANVAIRPRARQTGNTGRRLPTARDNVFRAPRTAAVLIRCEENKDRPGNVSYAEVMKLARSKISLEDLSISNTRIRRAQAGGLLIEIPGGEEAGTKAEALVGRLKEVLSESQFREEVQIVRPMRRAEIRLVDIDQSVSAEEVAEAVANNGQAHTADIRVGPLRPGRGGLNSVWVQCPLACANKLLSAGRMRVGWTMAGVVPLAKRRLQCFRCFAVGHTRANCMSQVDRSTWCFQCGSGDGHRAAGCRKPPKCPVCAGRGLPSGHRAGASECVPYNGPGPKLRENTSVTPAEVQVDGADRGAPTPGEGTREETMETCDG
ncbi:PREDICTED: uncharacterized protein LOC108767438 [Trachymyrmex cornetzi]|uniref:uncharacterized protein LOC108767438 n=1 Tax=Trachymyrmex cornetzi TaxID=471704 RepID=UPI00084ED40F|nr:PREDICTED: uncharacterized protein LOC108767438 [Trachymyrmex cornetzi]